MAPVAPKTAATALSAEVTSDPQEGRRPRADEQRWRRLNQANPGPRRNGAEVGEAVAD